MEVVSKQEPGFVKMEPSARARVLNKLNAIKWIARGGCHGTSGHLVQRAAVVAPSGENENAKVHFNIRFFLKFDRNIFFFREPV